MSSVNRPLTIEGMKELMHRFGWTMRVHVTDPIMFLWTKEIDGITLDCKLIPNQQDQWTYVLMYVPGVQVMVRIKTAEANFPHPKFTHWERRVFDYAQACEAVARTH